MRSGSWAIFTDLDGTLLSAIDFRCEAAIPLIRTLLSESVPIVPVTSKTAAEVIPLAEQLGLPGPLIVESGGAILWKRDGDWVRERVGVPVEELRRAAREIETEADAEIVLYSEMNEVDASGVSGLSGESLEQSRRREFDEPFVLRRGRIDRVRESAARRGLAVREGGRLLHLTGGEGKAEAVARVKDALRKSGAGMPLVVALGDAPIDAELLRRADIAILMPRSDGSVDARLAAAVPNARTAPAPAPMGWVRAIEQVRDEMRGRQNRSRHG